MFKDDLAHNLDLIRAHTRRLRILEKSLAEQGSSANPALEIEIEDIREKIERLRHEIVENTPVAAQEATVQASYNLSTLATPLEKYDTFFERLSGVLSDFHGTVDAGAFQQYILNGLAKAGEADIVFIARKNSDVWQATAQNDSKTSEITELLKYGSPLHNLLEYSSKKSLEEQDPQKHANVLSGVLPESAKLCLLISCRDTEKSMILVLYGMQTELEFDSAIGAALNTLLKLTGNLTTPPESFWRLEIRLYNEIRSQFRYVSDFIFERQFTLFQKRLQETTMYFEPIIYLGRSSSYDPPKIVGWEALARDTTTEKAPIDLFETAELWGTRFILELDKYYLEHATTKYWNEVKRIQKGPYPIFDTYLSVNVYPESLIRTFYRNTVSRISFPLDKLVLEISEKRPLPAVEGQKRKADQHPTNWFRTEHLEQHYMRHGIRFAIDDFGVGHASSSRMSRIRPAIIKIDRDALLDIYGERIFTYVTSQALSSSGHTQVIVEGLDDDSKFSLSELYKQDIRYVQGHALGQPVESIYTLSPETQENIRRQLEKVWKVNSAK